MKKLGTAQFLYEALPPRMHSDLEELLANELEDDGQKRRYFLNPAGAIVALNLQLIWEAGKEAAGQDKVQLLTNF